MGDDYDGPVTVQDSDNSERVLADKNVWGQSETITEMVKDTDPGDTIPLPNVPKEVLDKVVEYHYTLTLLQVKINEHGLKNIKRLWKHKTNYLYYFKR